MCLVAMGLGQRPEPLGVVVSVIPVLVTSGFVADHRPYNDWRNEGFAAFIPKPYDLDALAGTLWGVLNGRLHPSII